MDFSKLHILRELANGFLESVLLSASAGSVLFRTRDGELKFAAAR